MKILTLYSTSVHTAYKNSICSLPAFIVFTLTVFMILCPIYIIIYNSNELWYQPKIIYEQPIVSFQYKYILMGEYGSSLDINDDVNNMVDGSPALAVMSSFGFLNEITESWQKRGTVKYWKEDFDRNNVPDRLHFQFVYESTNEKLTYLSMFIELDAYIENHHCKLHVPAAVIISKELLPPNFLSGEISFEGKLKLEQKSSFHCPYFMRKVKSNFYYELIPTNSTHIHDYEVTQIRKKLANNVGFIQFEKTNTHWDRRSEDDKVVINLSVDIGEVKSRFHLTFWQKLLSFWTKYLAVLVIFVYFVSKFKFYLFSRRILRAWQIIPWQKIH
ncbi:Transmembrane protein [Pseudolycoriella hygida]|uniref:Transmembrane protein 231 n=1 Tax=Pseudolycoriella hygida TaxID=35572 RepID=A0A9Q0MLB9_9DIPT|nr:Transmembrane protein [Pseudolycoriella hygida]